MPTKKDIAWSELKVGVLVVIAIAILSAIVILVLGVESPFASRYTLYTHLPNIGGLRPGSTVMLEGLTIGTVKRFDFEGEVEKGIKIEMRLQKKYQSRIRTDSIAKLRSLGLLGDKYIEITQGTADGRVLAQGEDIVGAPPLDLDQMIAKATHTFDNMSDTVDNIKTVTENMKEGKGTVGQLFYNEALYKNMNELVTKMNKGTGTMSALMNDDTLYKELRDTAGNLRKVTSNLQNGESAAGKLLSDKELGKSIDTSVKKLEAIMARMDSGEGTLGKLSTDPALYNNLNKIVSDLGPVANQVSKGEGTVGQLFQNKQLYDNTNKFMSEMMLLVHDVRQDPKKYLKIKFSIF